MKHWVKVWIAKTIHNPDFQLLSPESKLSYLSAYILAGFCDAGGLLLHKGEPLTIKNIESITGIGCRRQALSVTELELGGFFQTHGDGTIEVLNWEAQQVSAEALKKRGQRSGNVPEKAGTNGSDCPPENGVLSPGLSPTQKYRYTPQVSSSLRSSEPSGPEKAEKAEAEWVKSLRESVRPTLEKPLKALGLEMRLRIGEYAAFRWANCTRDQKRNAKMGRNFAAQIASISEQKRFESLTVGEFLAAANRLWESTDKIPIRSLWHVQAALETVQ